MLKYGKLIRIITDIIDKPRQQHWTDTALGDIERAGNSGSTLMSCESRNQALPVIDSFGQTIELLTVTQKIRTHRQYHINRVLPLSPGFQKQVYKRNRLPAPVGVRVIRLTNGAVTKEFFKLIGHNQ